MLQTQGKVESYVVATMQPSCILAQCNILIELEYSNDQPNLTQSS